MGRKKNSSKNSSSKNSTPSNPIDSNRNGWISIDPRHIRYQHSRIRPHFSGCGRSVHQTLEDIRQDKIKPTDLPPIQVLVGRSEHNNKVGPWYFSLNNRRLWVLKQCREEGLLERDGNLIRVRVREAKSAAELERYTVKNCALEAKFIREKKSELSCGEKSFDRSEKRASLKESMKAVKLQSEVSIRNEQSEETRDVDERRNTETVNLTQGSDESSVEETFEKPYKNPYCFEDSDSSSINDED